MIKFFRQIRQNLLTDGKTSKYLKYAIGEIILVVIGILIAIQINNWNENYKNAQKERAYLINLQQDLTADRSRLEELKNDFETAAKSKMFLEKVVEEKSRSMDSLSIHFNNLSNIISDFVPNSTTLDELKNSNGLNVISNQALRRQIVTLYNTYDDLLIKINLGTEKFQRLYLYSGKYLKNINEPTNTEVSTLLDDNNYINQLRFNYSYTQLAITTKAHRLCVETLDLIKKELTR